ncbi:MAG: acetyl-CoA carboxylase biotin carboxyl carrier protein subunit [Opitutaceae bacterium]|jgi:biotin carboxyl carrier protein|nr:acetyl-CoA carboxylase biotin carboxyl carrier protein subunit [Opitutaceae bacterium]
MTKKLRVTVEGKAYEVLVEILDEGQVNAPAALAAPAIPAAAAAPVATAPVASVPAAVPASAPAPASATAPVAAASANDVPSPLAGKLVSIDVKVGQTVNEGDQVATIEAMKMNTYIFAPRSGKIAAIFAHPGDGVEEGAALLRIE